MTTQVSSDYDLMSTAFKKWADRINVDYKFWCANGDNDLFVNSIQTFADQGVNGFLFDPDLTVYPRIGDLMKEVKLPWMSVEGPAVGNDGKLIHPTVGFDYVQFGTDQINWLVDYQKKTWPGAKPSEIGLLALDLSIFQMLHARLPAEQDTWAKAYPDNAKNFFVSDGAAQGAAMNSDIGYNITAPVISAHPEIKYWLVAALCDDYAIGATRALETTGKDKSAVVLTAGGEPLIAQWDKGEDSCWKSALYTSQVVIAEPVFNGLYAMMAGQATAETLWPEWVQHSANEKYANVCLTSFFLTKDNYKSYLAYCDQYVGFKNSKYTWDGTVYDLGVPAVPASYNAPASPSPSK